MNQILIYFFIAISLSIDAFSLAISLGTLNPKKYIILKTSIIIGIFHFIMPILGSLIGNIFINSFINPHIIIFFIFIFLIIEIYFNKDTPKEIKILNTINIILISFSVSIDSFTVGIAFGLNKENIIISSIIFQIVSTTITYLGLLLGKYLKNTYQEKANYLSIIILFIVAIKYLIS